MPLATRDDKTGLAFRKLTEFFSYQAIHLQIETGADQMANQINIRALRRDPHIVVASLVANLLGLALPLVMLQVYDRIIPHQGYETLTVLTLGLLGAAVAEFCVRMARGHLFALGSLRFDNFAYEESIKRMLQFGTLRQNHDRGVDHDRLESIERVRKSYGSEAATALLDIPFILMFIMVMTLISPVMGVAISSISLLSVSIVWFQRKRILKDSHNRQDRDRRRYSFLMETLEGTQMIKSLGIEQLMQRRYERLMSVSTYMTHQLSGRVNFTQGMSAAIGLIAPVLMSGIGSVLVIAGQISIGGLAATVLLTSRVIQPTLRIEALLAGQRDTKRSEMDVHHLLQGPLLHTGQTELARIDEIELQDVTLSLGEHDDLIHQNLSVKLRRGDCVLLSGDEASGRSLLMSLIAGHITPTQGRILVNGMQMDQVAGRTLSERISLLSPDYTLLEGTLLENLTAFDVDRYNEAALNLAKELGISNFILRHADGLSMRVAAGATTSLPKSVHDGILLISGLVRQPDIILFDEANTGLDRQTDLCLIEILRRRIPETIILLVTHRPSYMALATRELRLNNHVLEEKTAVFKDVRVAS